MLVLEAGVNPKPFRPGLVSRLGNTIQAAWTVMGLDEVRAVEGMEACLP